MRFSFLCGFVCLSLGVSALSCWLLLSIRVLIGRTHIFCSGCFGFELGKGCCFLFLLTVSSNTCKEHFDVLGKLLESFLLFLGEFLGLDIFLNFFTLGWLRLINGWLMLFWLVEVEHQKLDVLSRQSLTNAANNVFS